MRGISTIFRLRSDWGRRRGWLVDTAAQCAALLGSIALSSCDLGVLDLKGPVGAAAKTILIDSLAIMLAIVIPTIVKVFAAAWWFRSSNTRARYLPDWEYSGH